MRSSRALSVALLSCLFVLSAAADDVPLRDWPVHRSGSRTALGDITGPSTFVAMAPCRVADTRDPAGPYGAPALAQGSPRTFDIVASACTGISPYATAFSLNLTATNTTGPGFLLAYPAGGTAPTVSTLNYVAGQTVANAAIVPGGTGSSRGKITVIAGVSATDLVIDINGYFVNLPNAGEQLLISTVIDNAASIVGFNFSSVDNSQGVGGFEGGTGKVYGVQGQVGSSAGMDSAGVHGVGASTAARSYGVYGEIHAAPSGSAGVYGYASDLTSAGVYGVHGYTISSNANSAGVWGEAANPGASGGIFTNPNLLTTFIATTANAGGPPAPAGTQNYGVWVYGGNILASGGVYATTKSFIEPHPTDPAREIVYTSVEAPSADIYFRGTAHLADGLATVEVPEHFRVSARPGDYQTSLTVVGGRGNAWVESEGPEGIVIRGTAATVHYVVYAERGVIEPQLPVRDNVHFTATALSRGDVRSLPEGYRDLLVKNGTLNPDLTLNRRTAERLGWTIPPQAAAK